MQGRYRAGGFHPSADAERCNVSGSGSAVTVDQYVVFAENCQGVHCRMESSNSCAEAVSIDVDRSASLKSGTLFQSAHPPLEIFDFFNRRHPQEL
jgi:hypothetical protein